MRNLVALSFVLLAVALSVPCRAQTAQAEEPNRAFFFRGGAGLNLASIHETNALDNGVPPDPPTTDYSAYGYDIDLELGISLARHVVLGGAVYLMSSTGQREPGSSSERGNLIVAALVDGFLVRTGEGPHILGFAGFSGLAARFAGGAGAGYDFKLSERWSVGPLARVAYAESSFFRTVAATLDVVATFN
jgi:hypothetical protein